VDVYQINPEQFMFNQIVLDMDHLTIYKVQRDGWIPWIWLSV
jgi:hypothetical protein